MQNIAVNKTRMIEGITKDKYNVAATNINGINISGR